MVGYDRHSETAEVLVNNDGLAIPSLLKVQSFPFGNLGGVVYLAWKNKNKKFTKKYRPYMLQSSMEMK
jgi:hypothetical protein